MRYVVKCVPDGRTATVQVLAADVHHAIEAARIMIDQGLKGIVVRDPDLGREAPIADFLIANGFDEIARNEDLRSGEA